MEPATPQRGIRLKKGEPNRDLTAEADRFREERIRLQLSTDPVDEAAAEELLCRAYATAGVPAPGHIHWLDGPLELVAILADASPCIFFAEPYQQYRERVPQCVWDDARLDGDEIARLSGSVLESVDHRIRQLQRRAERRIYAQVNAGGVHPGVGVEGGVWSRVIHPIWDAVRTGVGERIWRAVGEAVCSPVGQRIRDFMWGNADYSLWHSIRAYDEAPMLAEVRFYDEYRARNAAHALARFNELVSGYWLGRAVALLVRRPTRLERDAVGRLHSVNGPAVEYPDGWGFWAWHGVQVPEKVLLAPEELTREDFLGERNIEARRVIQERMGDRFVWELRGKFLDGGSHGVLYEVELPDDPEQVAHYLQVQDPSTGREYFLRVPPTIQTTAEAMAWTFGLSVEEYRPERET
jgi:hypothetical protein